MAVIGNSNIAWAFPAFRQLLFLLLFSLLHPIRELIKKLPTSFLLLHNRIDIFVHRHHALDIARQLFSFGVGSILKDRLLLSRVTVPDGLFDVYLSRYDLAVCYQLIIVVNN